VLEFARRHSISDLAFVLDNRPHREASNKRVSEFFERYQGIVQESPSITGVSFLGSQENTPLQACDMVAWEYYKYGLLWLQDKQAARRPHLQRLAEAKLLNVQFLDEEGIRALVAFNETQPMIRELGDAFEKGLSSLPPWLRE